MKQYHKKHNLAEHDRERRRSATTYSSSEQEDGRLFSRQCVEIGELQRVRVQQLLSTCLVFTHDIFVCGGSADISRATLHYSTSVSEHEVFSTDRLSGSLSCYSVRSRFYLFLMYRKLILISRLKLCNFSLSLRSKVTSFEYTKSLLLPTMSWVIASAFLSHFTLPLSDPWR